VRLVASQSNVWLGVWHAHQPGTAPEAEGSRACKQGTASLEALERQAKMRSAGAHVSPQVNVPSGTTRFATTLAVLSVLIFAMLSRVHMSPPTIWRTSSSPPATPPPPMLTACFTCRTGHRYDVLLPSSSTRCPLRPPIRRRWSHSPAPTHSPPLTACPTIPPLPCGCQTTATGDGRLSSGS
jgi:hypothetical protein